MDNTKNQNFLSKLRTIFWPIERAEYKKFLPMALMMFCALLNYSMLRSVKDGFVVTAIGPEAISFLKTYIVMPSAVIAIIIYAKLCNVMSQQKVFYTITTFFVVFFLVFGFLLYPNPTIIHPNPELIESWVAQYPNFKWFIKIIGSWSYASFYTISELWGSIMLSLLFWQFANKITKPKEAKRFYSMFGLLGNFALPCTGLILKYFLDKNVNIVAEEVRFIPIILVNALSGIVIMIVYWWMNKNVLTDPRFYDESAGSAKKSKAKLSLADSVKMIFSSKYLGLVTMLILCYGISINLVEGIWKSKINELHPTKEAYTLYMANFQFWQGSASILFMIIGANVLRTLSWRVAAMFTPIMILITGLIFFGFIFFDNIIAMHLTGILTSGPLVIAVMMGSIQNILSKATKYSLFDATKEMTYIPQDYEVQTKGKAAVEVFGGRFGKSGGGIIQSTVFMLFPALSFMEATPYFAAAFFIIAIIWIFVVKSLSTEYERELKVWNERNTEAEVKEVAKA